MKTLALIFLFIMSFGCAQVQPLHSKAIEKDFEFKVLKKELQPGKVSFIEFHIPQDFKSHTLYCPVIRDNKKVVKEIPLALEEGMAKTFIAETYFSDLKAFTCYIQYKNKEETVLAFDIKPFPYKSEKLNVAMSKVVLSPADQKRVEKEWLITSQLYKNSAKEFLFDEPFSAPLDSFLTSIYGNKRLFNNKKTSQHLGNDFRAKVGLPIPVANKGKVIYVGNLFYTGNVVIVDHGMNIFSNYAHLSRIDVKLGDELEKGQIVGLAGATGRVSGPHLHWGVKINDEWVDGFSLVKASEELFKNK